MNVFTPDKYAQSLSGFELNEVLEKPYLIKRRSNNLENQLAVFLRNGDEVDREFYIERLLRSSERGARFVGLSLLRRINMKKDFYFKAIDIGLSLKNPGEIGFWFKAIGPKLGAKRTVLYLASENVSADKLLSCFYYFSCTNMVLKDINGFERYTKAPETFRNKIEKDISDLDVFEAEYWKGFQPTYDRRH